MKESKLSFLLVGMAETPCRRGPTVQQSTCHCILGVLLAELLYPLNGLALLVVVPCLPSEFKDCVLPFLVDASLQLVHALSIGMFHWCKELVQAFPIGSIDLAKVE